MGKAKAQPARNAEIYNIGTHMDYDMFVYRLGWRQGFAVGMGVGFALGVLAGLLG